MKRDDQQYLRTLQLGTPIVRRANMVLDELAVLSPEPFERIFVSDQIVADSEDRLFTSLWGFSENYVCEAKSFLSTYDLDSSPMKDIQYMDVIFQDFSLHKPTYRKNSRLAVNVTLGNGTRLGSPPGRQAGSFLTGTGRNCTYLLTIINEVFVPRLRATGQTAINSDM